MDEHGSENRVRISETSSASGQFSSLAQAGPVALSSPYEVVSSLKAGLSLSCQDPSTTQQKA